MELPEGLKIGEDSVATVYSTVNGKFDRIVESDEVVLKEGEEAFIFSLKYQTYKDNLNITMDCCGKVLYDFEYTFSIKKSSVPKLAYVFGEYEFVRTYLTPKIEESLFNFIKEEGELTNVSNERFLDYLETVDAITKFFNITDVMLNITK